MGDFILSLFTSFILLVTGNQQAASVASTESVSPSPLPVPSITDVPSPKNYFDKKKKEVFVSPLPTTQPTIIQATIPPQKDRIYPTTYTVTIAPKNDFIPKVVIGTFRPSGGNCASNPSGSYTFTVANYSEADNITGVKIKGSADGLTPNTRYILNVGSTQQMGGRSIYTDGNGSVSFDIQDIAYTVHYKEIYSLSIDHPDKIFPNNVCLLGDLKDGLG